MSLLLPLDLTDNERPDVALVVELGRIGGLYRPDDSNDGDGV